MLKRTLAFALGWLILCSPAQIAATEDAEAIIKYRKSVLGAMGGEMKAMSTILRGRVKPENLASHAENMQRSSMLLGDLFPAGTDKGDTDALPAIWQNPRDFSRKMAAFEKAAKNLAAAAAKDDRRRTAMAIQQLGQSCKGCHDKYRAE